MVLRQLVALTAVIAVGRGIFYAVSALFLTRVVGLSLVEVGVGLTLAGAAGVVAALAGGAAADRFGAVRTLTLTVALQAMALVFYPWVPGFATFVLAAGVLSAAFQASSSARGAIVATAFAGAGRVVARARMRVATNLGISVGAVLGGAAIWLDTTASYRGVLMLAAVLYLAASLLVRRLSGALAEVTEERHTNRSQLDTDRMTQALDRWAPYRDRRYLVLVALSGVSFLQMGVFEVGVPLWIAGETEAPAWLYAALLLANTAMVVGLQVRLSRSSETVAGAGRASLQGGVLMAIACLAYAVAGTPGAVAAVCLLTVAMVLHTLAEILFSAGTWALGYELADESRPGAYQGLMTFGNATGTMIAPLVVTTALGHGYGGWSVLAVVFGVTGLGLAVLAARAARGASSPDDTGGHLTASSSRM